MGVTCFPEVDVTGSATQASRLTRSVHGPYHSQAPQGLPAAWSCAAFLPT